MMKRWQLIGLAILTTLLLLIFNRPSWDGQLSVRAPELELSAKAQSPSPSPETVTSPEVSPSPETVTSPEVSPSPAVSLPTGETTPSPERPKIIAAPAFEQFHKESRYEIGIVKDYKVSKVAGVPIIESADGQLAYTVVVKPQVSAQQLSNEALAEIAIATFERGEGFEVSGDLEAIAPGEIIMPWRGSLTIRGSQPISGRILARQNGRNVFLLLISATETKANNVPEVLNILSSSLKALSPE